MVSNIFGFRCHLSCFFINNNFFRYQFYHQWLFYRNNRKLLCNIYTQLLCNFFNFIYNSFIFRLFYIFHCRILCFVYRNLNIFTTAHTWIFGRNRLTTFHFQYDFERSNRSSTSFNKFNNAGFCLCSITSLRYSHNSQSSRSYTFSKHLYPKVTITICYQVIRRCTNINLHLSSIYSNTFFISHKTTYEIPCSLSSIFFLHQYCHYRIYNLVTFAFFSSNRGNINGCISIFITVCREDCIISTRLNTFYSKSVTCWCNIQSRNHNRSQHNFSTTFISSRTFNVIFHCFVSWSILTRIHSRISRINRDLSIRNFFYVN